MEEGNFHYELDDRKWRGKREKRECSRWMDAFDSEVLAYAAG